MKNPRMSEEMVYTANRYALAKEVTLDNREKKKESGHVDQPTSSMGHDKKRKQDHSVNTVEQHRHHKEYQPRTGEFKGFPDRICIFYPQGKHKTCDCDRLQGFADEVLKTANAVHQEKKPEDPKGDFMRLIKRSTTFSVALTHMSPRGSKNSQPKRSWWSNPPPPCTLDGLRPPIPSTIVANGTLYQSRGGIPR
jgi:hypothetical protein